MFFKSWFWILTKEAGKLSRFVHLVFIEYKNRMIQEKQRFILYLTTF